MAEPAYEIVNINETNLDEYDLLCHKSKKKGAGYQNKVRWIKDRFKENLRLKLLLVDEGPKKGFTSRGFIEYIPGEYTWRGIDAKGYMAVHCIWVIGKYKKKGYGTKLLEPCLNDAKGMNGVVMVTSEGNWLAGRALFVKNGFEKVDEAPPDFELYTKRFLDKAPLPKFREISQESMGRYGSGVTIFRSDQCPYAEDAARIISETARELALPVRVEHIENCKDAQNCFDPYGTFCVLYDGKVLTYHHVTGKQCKQLLTENRSS